MLRRNTENCTVKNARPHGRTRFGQRRRRRCLNGNCEQTKSTVQKIGILSVQRQSSAALANARETCQTWYCSSKKNKDRKGGGRGGESLSKIVARYAAFLTGQFQFDRQPCQKSHSVGGAIDVCRTDCFAYTHPRRQTERERDVWLAMHHQKIKKNIEKKMASWTTTTTAVLPGSPFPLCACMGGLCVC